MGTIKDRNSMDLTEDIKKRWQEYTEELCKTHILNDPNNHNGVITHLEADILDCKGKWVLGSITMNKADGIDGIPAELFQILKDDAVKVLHSYASKFGKPIGHRTGVGPFSFQSQRRMISNYLTIVLISHANKVILKILQARLQQYVNCEFPDLQAGFRKGRGTRDQIAKIHWIMEKVRVPEKHPLLLY